MCKWCNKPQLQEKECFELFKDYDEGKTCEEFNNHYNGIKKGSFS